MQAGQGGASSGFGGTSSGMKAGRGGGGTIFGQGGGSSGGKANSGGTLGLGGAVNRGGSTEVPPEGGQAGSVDHGSPTCHFIGGGGAGGEAGGISGGSGGDPGGGGAADVSALGSELLSFNASAGANSGTGAGGQGSASGPFAFCDDFDDGDAGGWDSDSCAWAVESDESPAYASGGGACLSTAGLAVWTDQVLEARVKVVTFGGTSNSYRAGLVARHTGSSNYYTLALAGDGSLRLLRGTSVLSGSGRCTDFNANVTTNTWYTLRLEVSGPMNAVRVRGYLDGTLSHDCSLTNNTHISGRAGVITTGSNTIARFDDFRVFTP